MRAKTKKITGWVLTILVIVFLLFDSIGKIVGIDESVKATIELGYPESTIGIIGLILLGITILYAVPRTSFIGLILMTAYFGGAVATHVREESPLFSHTLFPVYFALMAWAGLALRNKRLFQFLTHKI